MTCTDAGVPEILSEASRTVGGMSSNTDRGQPAGDVPPHEPALNEPTEPSRTTETTQTTEPTETTETGEPTTPTTPTTPTRAASPTLPGWRVGTLGGIPVFIGGGWVVIGLVMVVMFGPQVAPALPGLGALSYVVAAGYAVLLLLSVLPTRAPTPSSLGCAATASTGSSPTSWVVTPPTMRPGRRPVGARSWPWPARRPTEWSAWWAGPSCHMSAET